eukprot:m.217491 g.217491  ORF g.217491 m.217491 type:complete len:909 (+) comp33236_c0_seq15:2146-4872(+)
MFNMLALLMWSSCAMANPVWFEYAKDTNLVVGAAHGAAPWALMFGVTDSLAACEPKCAALSNCTGVTWHDETVTGWEKQCVGTTESTLHPLLQTHHHSACITGEGIYASCNSSSPPSPPPPPGPEDAEFDCEARKLAFEYARQLLPRKGDFQDAHDALEIDARCPNTTLSSSMPLRNVVADVPTKLTQGPVLFVSPIGSDSGKGTITDPFQTIAAAVTASRTLQEGVTIALRGGFVHTVTSPITLDARDSGLTIETYVMDATVATVSGGVALSGLEWSAAPGFPTGVSMAKLSASDAAVLGDFNQLFVDGDRQTRARHPNANFGQYFRTGLWTTPTGYIPMAKSWIRSPKLTANRTVSKPELRNTTRYSDFTLGYGGPVREFNPSAAYWAVNNPPAGGGCKYEVPVGLEFDEASFSGAKSPSTWTQPTNGIVHAFHHGHWGDWAFSINNINAQKHTIRFSRGGFQEARGSCGEGGREYYVEGIKELLDVPNEWWYDVETSELYYFANSTSSPPSMFVASKVDTLFNINATQESPAKNIRLHNMQMKYTATTFMRDYEVPSAGDWSVHRGGTVFVQGAENVSVDGCVFDQIGGNGVCISEYARSVSVTNNEFNRIGDSAVLVLGATGYMNDTPWIHTDGNYPINTLVSGNLAKEVGVFTKQTAFFFQALGWNSTVEGNVVFNGPRSGININDASFGGNVIKNNLLFNLVRETVDHGPFNTWDRQPYLTQAVYGDQAPPSADSLMSHVDSNFFICNYGAVKGIDHDDGSGWYADRNNYMVYCSGKMKGQTQTLTGNIYIYPSWQNQCVHVLGGMSASSAMLFENNTCVDTHGSIYSTCTTDHSVAVYQNNKFFVTGGNDTKIPQFSCADGSWKNWQASGQDTGSSMNGTIPSAQEMVAWGRDLLNIAPSN